ncbi:unnamed protein product, partial [Mesorhabditis belari]|uniref:Uncharacterized protein n=1 Tax=Mesorhabditis belari TaxID=2138241 RepID=A0AAF3FND2_9BILA
MYFYHIFLIQFFHRLEAIVTICPSTVFTTNQILTGITTLSTRITKHACLLRPQADITIDLSTPRDLLCRFPMIPTMLVNGCFVENVHVFISVTKWGSDHFGKWCTTARLGCGRWELDRYRFELTCDEDPQWEYLRGNLNKMNFIY